MQNLIERFRSKYKFWATFHFIVSLSTSFSSIFFARRSTGKETMAPKKKTQQQNPKTKSKPKSKAGSSDPKPAPKLQISAENERRLRRLLLNTDRPAPSQPPPDAAAQPSSSSLTFGVGGSSGDGASGETRAQKVKRLTNVYDKLSIEGFTSDQIEKSLSSLGVIPLTLHLWCFSFFYQHLKCVFLFIFLFFELNK